MEKSKATEIEILIPNFNASGLLGRFKQPSKNRLWIKQEKPYAAVDEAIGSRAKSQDSWRAT